MAALELNLFNIKNLTAKDLFNPTVVIALFLMVMIMMMILPVPAWILDAGLALSFSSAILIFMIVLFIERPLDFSSFPTVLLGSLLLRLSLNISSTKLIIGNGHTGTDAAGHVIEGFANFIMGGNLLMGLVVFLVIMIVNFMVITKGSGRMAEVGARFALDAMPGKQLAIDADVASGAITHEEANIRRKIEQEETTFYGSLDGASKFVKGDAVAGLIITALNFFVGIAMGTIYYDMPINEAMHTYSLLTVGDGLVTQIPAVIVSVASALLMAKGGAHGSVDIAILKQFIAYPPALWAVAALMAAFAIIPGLPFIPFMVGAAIIAFIGYKGYVNQKIKKEEDEKVKLDAMKSELGGISSIAKEKTLGDAMELDEIWLEFSKELVPQIMDETLGVAARISAMRKALAADLGFILPEIRLTDNPNLQGAYYVIKIHGVKVSEVKLKTGHLLVIKKDDSPVPYSVEDTTEPVYGAPACWIKDNNRENVSSLGYPVAGVNEIIATHLMEIIKSNMRELVTRGAVKRILDEFINVSNDKKKNSNEALLKEFIPDVVPRDLLHQVLRNLLEERIPIRNLPLILEGISEAKAYFTDSDQITEQVRRKLSLQISSSLLDTDGTLPVVQISNSWEELFQQYEVRDTKGTIIDVALPSQEIARLSDSINKGLVEASQKGRYATIVTNSQRRRLIRAIMDAKSIRNPVIAYEEIHPRIKPALCGVI